LVVKERTEAAGQANTDARTITLDPQMINNFSYRDKSGRKQKFSLQHVIFHEFIHISDPVVANFHVRVEEIQQEIDHKYRRVDSLFDKLPLLKSSPLMELWDDYKSDRFTEKFDRARIEEIEEYTVYRTNAVMQRHFGEEPRNGYGGNTNWLINASDPLIHHNTQHEESFIPLPIVDVVDAKRLELAAKLGRAIHEKMQETGSDTGQTASPALNNNPPIRIR